MKKKVIITGCLVTALFTTVIISYLLGVASVLTREVKGSVGINATVLSLIETGRTDRAIQLIEGQLIGYLNVLDSLEESEMRTCKWYVLNSNDTSGDKWERLRTYAETRVKTKRDEQNYLMTHPKEVVRRMEEAIEQELHDAGNTNLSVNYEGDGSFQFEKSKKKQ